MFTVNLVHPWRIRTPTVYRHLNEEYVERFFSSGELRLTPMCVFRTYPHEQRGDDHEGRVLAKSMGSDGFSFTLMSGVGAKAYVLCASTLMNADIEAAFQTNSAFRIKNTTAFASAIASEIPGFCEGIEGPCVYTDEPVSVRNVEGQTIKDFTDPKTGTIIMGGPGQAEIMQKMMDPEDYFKKRLRFQSQSEYRFVWITNKETTDFLTVRSPQAAGFCERVIMQTTINGQSNGESVT